MSDEQETVLPSYRVSVDNDGKPMVIAADESTRLAIVRLCNYVQQHTAGAAWSDARDVLAAIEAPEFQTEQPKDAAEPKHQPTCPLRQKAHAKIVRGQYCETCLTFTKNAEQAFREPTDEEIGNSDTVATVFIKVRIEQLKAMREACVCKFQGHGHHCNLCIGYSAAIRELENVL